MIAFRDLRIQRRYSRWRVFLIWIVVFVLLVADGISPVAAQIPKVPRIRQFGIDGFRLMLQQQGLSTEQTVAAALANPTSSVMVILGDLTTVERVQHQVGQFVDAGGALLYASDLGGKTMKEPLHGIRIRPRVVSSRDTRYAYRGLNDCPIVSDFNPKLAGRLLDGVSTIVTNIPARLQGIRPRGPVRSVAWLPGRNRSDSYSLMAVYRPRFTGGRMLMLADHSLFINSMLIHGDNAKFASNVTKWLCEGGKRTSLIVIHDGQILSTWGLGDRPPAIPLSSLIKAAQDGGLGNLPIGNSFWPILNDSLDQFQAADGFNIFLSKAGDRLPKIGDRRQQSRPLRFVLFILMGIVLFGFTTWLLTTRKRAKRFLSFQDWNQPSESKFEAALSNKQYQACIRMLARDFFLDMGADHFESKRPAIGSGSAPGAASKVTKLWKLATKRSWMRMSRRRYEKTVNLLNELRQLHQHGKLSLE